MNDTVELPADGWRLVTDGVMGGVSQGTMSPDTRDGRACVALRGRVSTENNGGFIQMALDLPAALRTAETYDGLVLSVTGNDEDYNVHLRTAGLWLPWQSYRATFRATPDWSRISLPFTSFEAYRTDRRFDPAGLRRIGIVAIGRDFDADVCVRDVAFYRSRP